jgi:hypothetical protein
MILNDGNKHFISFFSLFSLFYCLCRTTYTANDTLLAEIERMAEVHNGIADKLENEIYKSTQNFVKEKSRSRKKVWRKFFVWLFKS